MLYANRPFVMNYSLYLLKVAPILGFFIKIISKAFKIPNIVLLGRIVPLISLGDLKNASTK